MTPLHDIHCWCLGKAFSPNAQKFLSMIFFYFASPLSAFYVWTRFFCPRAVLLVHFICIPNQCPLKQWNNIFTQYFNFFKYKIDLRFFFFIANLQNLIIKQTQSHSKLLSTLQLWNMSQEPSLKNEKEKVQILSNQWLSRKNYYRNKISFHILIGRI